MRELLASELETCRRTLQEWSALDGVPRAVSAPLAAADEDADELQWLQLLRLQLLRDALDRPGRPLPEE